MNYSAEITTVRQKLAGLNAPPKPLEHTVFEEREAICDKHGMFKQRCRRMALHGKGIETKTESPACLTEKLTQLQRAEAEQEQHRKHSKIKALMDKLNLPERFADVTLDNYEPVNPDAARCLKLCKDYATHWPERLKRGGGLVMCGKPGTGKIIWHCRLRNTLSTNIKVQLYSRQFCELPANLNQPGAKTQNVQKLMLSSAIRNLTCSSSTR